MASDIEICNVALNSLGAQTIRSFDEDNKPARSCSIAYPHARDSLLGTHYWTFARTSLALAEVPQTHPYYNYVYQLPTDCFQPFFIDYKNPWVNWEVEGDKLITNLYPVILRYITHVTATGKFTQNFSACLSAVVAGEIAYSIVQDKVLARERRQEAENRILRAQAKDAAIGNTYREAMEDPEQDPFVNPDAKVVPFTREYSWLSTV